MTEADDLFFFEDDGIPIINSIVQTLKAQLASFLKKETKTVATVKAKIAAIRATADYFVKTFNAYRLDIFNDPPVPEDPIIFDYVTKYEDVLRAIETYESGYAFDAITAAAVRDAIYNYNPLPPKRDHLLILHDFVHNMKNTPDEGSHLAMLVKTALTLPKMKKIPFDTGKTVSNLDNLISLVDELMNDRDNISLQNKTYAAGMKHAWNLMKNIAVSEYLCEVCQNNPASYIERDSCRLLCGMQCE